MIRTKPYEATECPKRSILEPIVRLLEQIPLLVNLAVLPLVLALLAVFGTFWLIKDLWNGYCCEECLYYRREARP